MGARRGFREPGFLLVITSHSLNHGYSSLMPVLYPSLIAEFRLSYGLVGALAMGYRLTSGSLQIVMGFLGRFVRRKTLLGLGMIWQSAAHALATLSGGFGGVLAGRSLAGVGASPQHPVGSSYIAEAFPRARLGRAMGLNLVVASAGGLAGPLLGSLILSSLGWRWAMLALAVPSLLIGLMFLFVREAGRPSNWSGASSLRLLGRGLRDVLRNRIVLTVMVVETVMAFRMGAWEFIPSYLTKERGIEPLEAGAIFAAFLAAGLPSAYFWGHLSDRLDRRRVVMLAMGMAAVLWPLLPYSGGTALLVLNLVLIGFTGQGVGGVIQAYVAEATSLENRDIVYGIYFTLAFTIGSFSPLLVGYLADTVGFGASFLYVGLISLSAVVASQFMR